ncbi:PIN domain-containing protein [Moraxella equi]|uniref:PIN-like domain-containing protein n=1 Tax=Moraxella equi TaxID=60442 RepID=A0A378QN08_9GAMM|nr:PIN domain-containing protein [Moraxella equi]OPH39580.1 hypothetical protein B5J93_03485 [Moraxella equi]STZ02279.1 Uncharacterised protein [Moraxella equi]
MKHYLIDYENIQPNDFNRLNPNQCQIWLFVGKNQTTLPISFSEAQAQFGKAFHLIQVPKSGKNALDFILSSEMGRIIENNPNDEFLIVSKDAGFDVLIEYYQQQVKSIQRVGHANNIQLDNTKHKKRLSIIDMLSLALLPKVKQSYHKMPEHCLPKSQKSLMNFILSILKNELKDYDDEYKQYICQKLANQFI